MNPATVYFLIQELADVPADTRWLSESENLRAAELRFPKRRTDWLLGRWTAKLALRHSLILSGLADPALAAIEIKNDPDGAPGAFLAGRPVGFSISISHCNPYGFCVVALPGLALGCDLEAIQPHGVEFFADYFCAGEWAIVQNARFDEQPLLATLIWSAKESALKCLRQGLRRDTRSVQVAFGGHNGSGWQPLTVTCLESKRLFHGWWRTDSGCVQTIAAESVFGMPVKLGP